MTVWVAYARPDQQWEIPLPFREGMTVRVAIRESGVLDACPELSETALSVGIFSRPAGLDDVLEVGNRVEIYRPLTIDPKEARRHRAALKKR